MPGYLTEEVKKILIADAEKDITEQIKQINEIKIKLLEIQQELDQWRNGFRANWGIKLLNDLLENTFNSDIIQHLKNLADYVRALQEKQDSMKKALDDMEKRHNNVLTNLRLFSVHQSFNYYLPLQSNKTNFMQPKDNGINSKQTNKQKYTTTTPSYRQPRIY
jgi:hypothetical protein